ncbi:MAG: ABC transporter permease [Thermomicrobiales bacterium]
MAEAAVAGQPIAPEPEEREEAQATGFSLRGALRLLLATGSGKAGVALFVLMIGLSIYVLFTYPLRFGEERWSNPAIWADNPKAAPPVWTSWIGGGAYEHTTLTQSEPVEVRQVPQGEGRIFRFPISIDSEVPSFVSLTLTGVTFHGPRPPSVIVTLTRPDGGVVGLANPPISGPRQGETAPYRRFYDSPERILITEQDIAGDRLQQTYQQLYPDAPLPANLDDRLAEGLFGMPTTDGVIVPLAGDYSLDVQVFVTDPDDEVNALETVLGGTVFGVMGTDALGRDLFEGLLYGFPVALLIAALASVLSTVIGASLGILSGYAGGATDATIQRLSDIISNVPLLPLLIYLVFLLGSHLYLIILVLVAFSWPGLTILVRSMVLQIRSGQLVEAAQALGASRARIMVRHIFPQVAPFIVAQMIFFAPGAILAEASLSFLGLGDPSIPTWGQMLEQGFRTGALYVGYWWWVIPPGVLIVFTALAFMLLALAMEPIVDPRLRQTN